MRLDRFLSNRGAGTRSEVHALLKKRRVTVSGETVTDPGFQIKGTENVAVSGEKVDSDEFVYILLNKPAGYITAKSDAKSPTVMSLIPSVRPDIVPVGRLDKDTEGILLFTNDGEMNHFLTSPSHSVEKIYYAELSEDLPKDAEKRLSEPIVFRDFISKPAYLQKITNKSARLTVTEGRFHEVKRLFHAIGTDVVYLRREAFAGLTAEGLSEGEYRFLTEEEILMLRERMMR